jgi:hypothetical protein
MIGLAHVAVHVLNRGCGAEDVRHAFIEVLVAIEYAVLGKSLGLGWLRVGAGAPTKHILQAEKSDGA